MDLTVSVPELSYVLFISYIFAKFLLLHVCKFIMVMLPCIFFCTKCDILKHFHLESDI